MNHELPKVSSQTRRAPRLALDGKVTVRLVSNAIHGSGQNVSEQGVFFLADGSVPVEIEVEGHDGVIAGKLIRAESMGPESLGIAVKFDDLQQDLVGGDR
ncbi:MAG: PilZ domain-containing protein [Planctomycetota bacterium]